MTRTRRPLVTASRKNACPLPSGQRKAAIGVVDKIFNAQDKKWEEGTPDLKLQYFALSVLMGDRTYDLLTKLSLK